MPFGPGSSRSLTPAHPAGLWAVPKSAGWRSPEKQSGNTGEPLHPWQNPTYRSPNAYVAPTLLPPFTEHLLRTLPSRLPNRGVWSSSYRRENNPGAAQLPRRRTQLTVIKEDGLEERTISVTCVHLTHYPTCAPARPGVYRYYLNTFTNIK